MKRVLLLLAAAAILSAGCSKDSIISTDDPVDTSYIDNDDPEEEYGSDDDIASVDFDRTISIDWSGSSVNVSGDENGIVSVSGGNVTVNNADTLEVIRYELSGTCSDGSFKLYSSRKQALVLQGLDLSSKSGAAINNQSKKRTFVVLQGSSKLADGELSSSGDYKNAVSTEDCKAAFFSEGQLVFSGSGSLTVTATGKAGITSDDYLRFMGSQTVSVSSTAGHALRGKDAIVIDDGTISAKTSAAGKKGLTSDGTVTINGGTIDINVSGGTVYEDSDYTGSAGVKADSTFCITGGVLTIANSGQGGKGISGDTDALFKGGSVSVSVTGANLSSSGGTRAEATAWGPGGGMGGGGGRPGGESSNLKSAKGIKFDGNITISGGSINVTAASHEAIESKGKLTVSGGSLYAYSKSDDAINSAGDMNLTGGYVYGISNGNDAIDANGNLYIKGASVFAVCTAGGAEVAVDANTEGGKKLYLQSGSLVAIGGIESGSSITGTAYSCSGWTKSGWNALYDASGNLAFAFKAPSSGSNMVVYCNGKEPNVKSGVTVSGETIWDGNGATSSVSGGKDASIGTYNSSNRR